MAMMLALLAVAAAADPVPERVYHRPGATPTQVEADLRRCRIATTGPMAGGERPDGAARLDNGALAAVPAETIEGCMAAYGWRVRTLLSRERRSLSHGGPEVRRRDLGRLVGR